MFEVFVPLRSSQGFVIGFTGKLITRYLLAHREKDTFTFAVAGRSKSKLAELVSSLDLPASVPVFTVDVTKLDEVDAVVQKTKVVINTVGPYIKWSTPVVGYVRSSSLLDSSYRFAWF